MKKVFPLLLLVLIFSAEAFSQEDQNAIRPQAYRISSGRKTIEQTRPQSYIVREISDTVPQAYLFGSSRSDNQTGVSRPRVYQTEQPKIALNSKTDNAFNLERRAFELINQRRENSGLPRLKWSDDVANIARLHSENMANYKFFQPYGFRRFDGQRSRGYSGN